MLKVSSRDLLSGDGPVKHPECWGMLHWAFHAHWTPCQPVQHDTATEF